jgi:hypothetical protein
MTNIEPNSLAIATAKKQMLSWIKPRAHKTSLSMEKSTDVMPIPEGYQQHLVGNNGIY